jgi:hypothetical protein
LVLVIKVENRMDENEVDKQMDKQMHKQMDKQMGMADNEKSVGVDKRVQALDET